MDIRYQIKVRGASPCHFLMILLSLNYNYIMKKNAKNSVFFRLELSQFSVIIRFATEAEEMLHHCSYSVVYCDQSIPRHKTIKIKGFDNFDDAQDFVFVNYAWMFIPTRQYMHEGRHLFVY